MPRTARHDSRLRDHDTQRIALEVMCEVAHIADARPTIAQRARAVLDSLARVNPFEGSWLAILGPEHSEHHSLEQRGYGASTDAYLRSTGVLEDVEMTGINRAAAPICARRLPVAPQELRVWADYLVPSGFREGGAIGLFADHRYLGMVAVHTDTAAHPTDGALDLLQLIAPMIGRAVDPLRGTSETAQVVHQAEAGIFLTRDGRAHPLPGLGRHPLLDADTPLRPAVAAHLARVRTSAPSCAQTTPSPNEAATNASRYCPATASRRSISPQP
jgi:GAF domain-containing protein